MEGTFGNVKDTPVYFNGVSAHFRGIFIKQAKYLPKGKNTFFDDEKNSTE